MLLASGLIVIVAVVVALLVALADDDTEREGSPAADVAFDADAKSVARSAQTALEVYATDNGGDYTGVGVDDLREIEPSLPEDGIEIVSAGTANYELTYASETGSTFTVIRNSDGSVVRTCDPFGVGGCPGSGVW